MGPFSRWAVRKPKTAIGVWLLSAIVIGILATNFGGTYNDSFALPDTESTQAQDLLQKMPGASSATNDATSKVVWGTDEGSVKSAAVSRPITELLTELSQNPSVACVETPYGAALGTDCPAAQPTPKPTAQEQAIYNKLPAESKKILAGMGPSGISLNNEVGFATLTYSVEADALPMNDAKQILSDVSAVNGTGGLTVGINGQALQMASMEPPSSEGIGIIVALAILMLAFGSIVAAFLPIVTAILSLALGQMAVLLVAHIFSVATFAPTLAAMIGLGVGIDYSLFVINRYKQAIDEGKDTRAAALESVGTAGKAVLFAAATVVIALMGLLVLGIDFFNGIAVAAAATVILMMIGATFLLPAILSLLGPKAFAIKLPWARKRTAKDFNTGLFAKYGAWLEKHYKWFGALALALLIVIAIPAMSLRQGFTDDGGQPAGTPAKVSYDLLSDGFGPGITGPFFVAVETEKPGDNTPVLALTAALAEQAGVAAAIPLPLAKDSTITAIQVVSEYDPQSVDTTETLSTMRGYTIPVALAVSEQLPEGSGAQAYVGGFQAVAQDFTSVLSEALPLFLLVVIGLGFLVLILLFRSILVPLTGAATSLLSLAASLGVTVAVFQWGWFNSLLGVSGTGPIAPFLPIMVFAILFGLSMDYQVFLVSRMHEEWEESRDNRKAVLRGIASSGRVVAIAAIIMTSVFAAFILPTDPTIKLFGVALSTAIIFDAFVVRLVIVPSIMLALGKSNWWAPKWLKKILPKFSVE